MVLGTFAVLRFGLSLYRKPAFLRNFEEEEYGREHPFIEPVFVADGLAEHAVGDGKPVLLFPYPHGHTAAQVAQSPIAGILTRMGRGVAAFDVPGAYRSVREPVAIWKR